MAGVVLIGLAGCGGAANAPSADTRTAGSPSGPPASSAAARGPDVSSPAVSSTPVSSPPVSSPPVSSPPVSSPGPSGSAANSPSANRPAPTAVERVTDPRAEDLTTGLTSPWGLVVLPDGAVLVGERDTGDIVHLDGNTTRTLTTLTAVEPAGEGGLLGLALSRDNRTVFAYYTAAEDNRIVAMSWDGQELGEPRTILDKIPKGGRHNGGRLVLGPDGYLYVGTGETGDTSLAQDKESLGGKILRITVEGKPAPGNPFYNEVWSYGHRNVEGLAFDDSGRLWASEFGEQTWDELNLITSGGNYGWPEVEGSGDAEGLVNPKMVWRTSEASPSGLAYWRGDLWMAALRGARLWQIPLDGTEVSDPESHFAGDYGRLRSVAVGADGDTLLLTSSNTDGRGEVHSGDDRILRVSG